MSLSPQAIAVDSTRNLVFVGQNDSFGQGIGEVAVIDGASNTVLTTIPVSQSVSQTGLAVNESTGRVYAALGPVGPGLEVIDADDLTVTSLIGPPRAHLVGVNPVTNRIYAYAGPPSTGLQVIDGATEAIVASIGLPASPSDLAVDPVRNEVYVVVSPSGFAVIDGGTDTLVTTVPISIFTNNVGVDPSLGRAYFTERTDDPAATLFAVDTATLTTLAAMPVGPRTEGVGVDTSTHRVYTGSGAGFPDRGVTVVDGFGLAVVDFVPTALPVGRPVGVNPVTHRIYIPDGQPEPNGHVVVLQDAPPILDVFVDIKPGSFPNSINLSSSGVVPVAILSTADFAAPAEVNPETVTLAGAAVRLVGNRGRWLCHDEDVNGDGLLDLVCQVETGQMLLEEGQSVAVLEAATFGGTAVRGEDSVQIVPDED